MSFPLDTSITAEPPKEKPPPPPLELSDDEDKAVQQNNSTTNAAHNNKKPNLGRLDSTKRIKKDIQRKRSDFLGIEGTNDDSYLECGMYIISQLKSVRFFFTSTSYLFPFVIFQS